MKYSVIDLFSGAGGLSRGFGNTGRFSTEYAVEIEPHFSKTFSRNIRNSEGQPTEVFTGDIHELLDSPQILDEALRKIGLFEPGSLDVLVGGPPCQGFSRNGMRKYGIDGIRFYDAPINHLYKAFLDVLARTMPRVVVIENVREFLKAGNGKFRDDLFSRLEELGYEAEARILSAAEHGVPQLRHRMIVVAWRTQNPVAFPAPSFGPQSEGNAPFRTVRDAIGDLPLPSYEDRNALLKYPSETLVSSLSKELRSHSGVVGSHFARYLSEKNLARVRAVGTGRMKDISPELQTKSFYGSAYRRLSWDEPSLTITTWVYHVGSGRFAHPEQDRGLTMREAARLQSFDDDFAFPPLINPVSRMIGNAVPPLLASAIANCVADALDLDEERTANATRGLKMSTRISAPPLF